MSAHTLCDDVIYFTDKIKLHYNNVEGWTECSAALEYVQTQILKINFGVC